MIVSQEKIKEFIKEQHAIDGMVSIHDFELWLEEQPRVGEWTPCSLMLPKKHEHVLVTWKCGEYYHTTEAVYEDNGWLHYCPKELPGDIIEFIAWMPLPPAYKEDTNGEDD